MKMKFVFLVFGIGFGFILSRGGATTPELYSTMFLFEDFHLMFLMMTAMSVGIIGYFLLRKFEVKPLLTDGEMRFDKKQMTKHLVLGSLLFGMGWGLSGTCPGTAAAMVGEGRGVAIFAFLGAMLGTYIYGIFVSKKLIEKA
jgi:uncharacterized protein